MTRSQGRYSDRSTARYSARPTDTERETQRHRDSDTPLWLSLHGMSSLGTAAETTGRSVLTNAMQVES